MKDKEIAEILEKENEEFRRMCQEHKNLGEALEKIDKNRHLTSEEELERKKIQKQKLLKKDQMAILIREYKKLKNER